MSQLIFSNLSIDQLWNEDKLLQELFPLRIPSSEKLIRSYEDLAYFAGGQDDLCLCFSELDPQFREYLNQFFLPPQGVAIPSNPFDGEAWLEDVQKLDLASRGPFSRLKAVALSQNESGLCQLFNLKRPFGSFDQSDFQKWNRKSFLVQWALSHQIPFPETIVIDDLHQWVSQQNLKRGPSAEGSRFILKSDFGSGGGGVFDLQQWHPRFIDHLKKLLEKNQGTSPPNGWLFQTLYSRQTDFSVCGSIVDQSEEVIMERGISKTRRDPSACATPFRLFQVTYDEHNLSMVHRPLAPDHALLARIESTYSLLADELIEAGYRGPFGFDGFVTSDHRIFPIVDLNLRATKSHYIDEAAQCFDLQNWQSFRLRWKQVGSQSFFSFFGKLQERLHLDSKGLNSSGYGVHPYLMGTLIDGSGTANRGEFCTRELSFFCARKEIEAKTQTQQEEETDSQKNDSLGSKINSESTTPLNDWCNRVCRTIEEVVHEK